MLCTPSRCFWPASVHNFIIFLVQKYILITHIVKVLISLNKITVARHGNPHDCSKILLNFLLFRCEDEIQGDFETVVSLSNKLLQCAFSNSTFSVTYVVYFISILTTTLILWYSMWFHSLMLSIIISYPNFSLFFQEKKKITIIFLGSLLCLLDAVTPPPPRPEAARPRGNVISQRADWGKYEGLDEGGAGSRGQ